MSRKIVVTRRCFVNWGGTGNDETKCMNTVAQQNEESDFGL